MTTQDDHAPGSVLKRVTRLRDADVAICDDCGMAHDRLDPYWGVNKFKWMHERGTGHKVDYYRIVLVHTNTVESAWSLFKRSIVGSYHHLSAKHLDAYLDEFEFRFNNRENLFLFRDTLVRLLESEHLTYQELVAQ